MNVSFCRHLHGYGSGVLPTRSWIYVKLSRWLRVFNKPFLVTSSPMGLKGDICHFKKWQIPPFYLSEGHSWILHNSFYIWWRGCGRVVYFSRDWKRLKVLDVYGNEICFWFGCKISLKYCSIAWKRISRVQITVPLDIHDVLWWWTRESNLCVVSWSFVHPLWVVSFLTRNTTWTEWIKIVRLLRIADSGH